MKKSLKIFSIIMGVFLLSACGCMKNTAKGAVEDYLNQYKNLSSNVTSDLEDVVSKEDLTEEQKDVYRDVLKKQYKDLRYKIESEEYDDTALITTKITVYDYFKAQKEADEYLENNKEEFVGEDNTYSKDLFMDYKLNNMKKTTDTVEYTIIFKATKNDSGNYEVVDLSQSDLEKIHGIYNYDND